MVIAEVNSLLLETSRFDNEYDFYSDENDFLFLIRVRKITAGSRVRIGVARVVNTPDLMLAFRDNISSHNERYTKT